MTRAKLEALVEDLIARTLPPCKTALGDAGISASDIDEIVMVGGMTSGILAKHEFKGGKARYEELNEGHHDHLIDVKSGEIIEFVDEEIEKLQKKVAEKYGYKLVDHKLELYGIKKKS